MKKLKKKSESRNLSDEVEYIDPFAFDSELWNMRKATEILVDAISTTPRNSVTKKKTQGYEGYIPIPQGYVPIYKHPI